MNGLTVFLLPDGVSSSCFLPLTVIKQVFYVIPHECLCPLVGTSLLQEIVYLVSQGADPDEIGLMNIDEQLPVLEYPQPGLDIIQVSSSVIFSF